MAVSRIAAALVSMAGPLMAQELAYHVETPRLVADIALSAEAEAHPALATILRNDALAVLDEVRAWAMADTTSARPYDLRITDEARFVSPAFVGIVRTTYVDSGGAHGNTAIEGRTWEVAAGDFVGLEAFFPEGSPAYAAISAVLREIIARDVYGGQPIGDFWAGDVAKATAPDPQTLRNFTLTAGDAPGVATGLDFLFAPYAIAAYVYGAHSLTVGRDVFAAHLRPERRALFGLSP